MLFSQTVSLNIVEKYACKKPENEEPNINKPNKI